jgi:glycerophosphoryl diester phosphodiesterase
MAAFELSRVEGADGVELDVRLDGSGRVIVLHDPTLERVTGGGEVRHAEDISAREMARLDVGKGERVPTLAEVLRWAREHGQRVTPLLRVVVGTASAGVAARLVGAQEAACDEVRAGVAAIGGECVASGACARE